MVKDLIFRGVQKSAQECENAGVNTIEGNASKKSDRKGESFGDEVASLVGEVVAGRAVQMGKSAEAGKIVVT